LATKDEGLLRAAALIELWRREYVEPVQAPPCPYHILAQQLMALILQERGIGKSQWFSWVAAVPAFSQMPTERVAALVEYMIAKLILWDDNGIISFAPEGESIFGRQNFMDLLSVFTSPPLFRVMFGQKELGFVHESTFFKKDDDGPPILALAGRSWKTRNLDWNRKIAHVEPSEQKGKSRWLGEGQMLSQAICQSIRRILSGDENDPAWSSRAKSQFAEIREEFPWISAESTSIVLQPNGELRWWTFAGGIANTLLADALKPHCDVKGDNLSLVFPKATSLDSIAALINEIEPENVTPIPNVQAMENLKFSECLSPEIAAEVFTSRFEDRVGVVQALEERRRVVGNSQ
jgi:ATP-dependent helicase Lhr and Lhr-like helicase